MKEKKKLTKKTAISEKKGESVEIKYDVITPEQTEPAPKAIEEIDY